MPGCYLCMLLGLLTFSAFPANRMGLHASSEYVIGLLVGVLLAALLGLVVGPPQEARAALGLPAAGAPRVCLGAALALALIVLGLGFGGVGLTDQVRKLQLEGIRSSVYLTGCTLALCAATIDRVPLGPVRKRRVLWLHLSAAVGFLIVGGAGLVWPGGFVRDIPVGPLLFVALGTFVFLLQYYVSQLLRKRGLCQVCDYDLTGNVSGRCPECGTPIAAGTEAAAPPGPAEVKSTE